MGKEAAWGHSREAVECSCEDSTCGRGFCPFSPRGTELNLHQFSGNQEYLFLLLKDLLQAMEMMESQTLLLTLLTVKVRMKPLFMYVADGRVAAVSHRGKVPSGLNFCFAFPRWRMACLHSKNRQKRT